MKECLLLDFIERGMYEIRPEVTTMDEQDGRARAIRPRNGNVIDKET
jgi:hypothetical protein